jgi:hypothetical protein
VRLRGPIDGSRFAGRLIGRKLQQIALAGRTAVPVAAVIGFAVTAHLEKTGQCGEMSCPPPVVQGRRGRFAGLVPLIRQATLSRPPSHPVQRGNLAAKSLCGRARLPSKIEPVETSEMTPA